MEFDALPQREIERDRIGKLPLGCEQRLDLESVGVAIDQPVPGLMRNHQTGPQLVVVGIDIRDAVPEHDTQGVRALLCLRLLRDAEQRQRRNDNAEYSSSDHHYLRLVRTLVIPTLIREMALYHALAGKCSRLWRLAAAAIDGDPAARMKSAARREYWRDPA